jgi:hypothetical protein
MFSQDIKDTLDRKETVLAAFVDLRSAYDSCWRLKLVGKSQKG